MVAPRDTHLQHSNKHMITWNGDGTARQSYMYATGDSMVSHSRMETLCGCSHWQYPGGNLGSCTDCGPDHTGSLTETNLSHTKYAHKSTTPHNCLKPCLPRFYGLNLSLPCLVRGEIPSQSLQFQENIWNWLTKILHHPLLLHLTILATTDNLSSTCTSNIPNRIRDEFFRRGELCRMAQRIQKISTNHTGHKCVHWTMLLMADVTLAILLLYILWLCTICRHIPACMMLLRWMQCCTVLWVCVVQYRTWSLSLHIGANAGEIYESHATVMLGQPT